MLIFFFFFLFSFLASYYEPPIAPPPLKGKGYLTLGYGDTGSVPHMFTLQEKQKVDVGILKLFLSKEQVSLKHVAQSSPFVPSQEQDNLSHHDIARSSTPFVWSKEQDNLTHVAQPSPFVSRNRAALPREAVKARQIRAAPTTPEILWDTIEIPVVQRHADTSQIR